MKLYSKILGEGHHLIILHGLFGMSDNWQSLGKKWAENNTVHLLDLRNHGKSPNTDEFTYSAMSDDLLEYLDEHQVESAHILGHSLGGKMAMLFAALNPKRIDKLIIADISPRYYQPHHTDIINALLALKIENIHSRKEAQDKFAELFHDAGVRQFLLKSLYWEDKEKLNWRFNLPAIAEQIENVGEGLPDIAFYEKETLFIKGGNSRYVQDKDLELIERHFPAYKLETIEGAGHWLHAEKPNEFFTLTSRYLQGQ